MFISKLPAALLTCALGASLLSACGNPDQNANTTTTTGSPAATDSSNTMGGTGPMGTVPADSMGGAMNGGNTNMSGGSGTTNEGGMGNTGASK